jgi:hypothetical protein
MDKKFTQLEHISRETDRFLKDVILVFSTTATVTDELVKLEKESINQLSYLEQKNLVTKLLTEHFGLTPTREDLLNQVRLADIRAQVNIPTLIPLSTFTGFAEANFANQGDAYKQILFSDAPQQVLREVMRQHGQVSGRDVRYLIESQSADVNRSIVEIASNAADFSVPNGDVLVNTFTEGEKPGYTVRDFGPGMSDEHIFKRLAIPYISGERAKGKSSIGKFGLGFMTTLNHLKQHGDYVLVKTCFAAEPDVVYYIRYVYLDGQIYVAPQAVAQNADNLFIGTEVTVAAAEIETSEIVENLSHYLSYKRGVNIFLDDILINTHTDLQVLETRLGDEPVLLEYSGDNQTDSIKLLVNGVLIESIDVSAVNTIGTLILDLAPSTDLAESRAEIKYDNFVANQLRQVITTLGTIELDIQTKLKIINALTEVIYRLQTRLVQLSADNDLMVDLSRIATDLIKDTAYYFVPAITEFSQLNLPNSLLIHPNLNIAEVAAIPGTKLCTEFSASDKIFLQLPYPKAANANTPPVFCFGDYIIFDANAYQHQQALPSYFHTYLKEVLKVSNVGVNLRNNSPKEYPQIPNTIDPYAAVATAMDKYKEIDRQEINAFLGIDGIVSNRYFDKEYKNPNDKGDRKTECVLHQEFVDSAIAYVYGNNSIRPDLANITNYAKAQNHILENIVVIQESLDCARFLYQVQDEFGSSLVNVSANQRLDIALTFIKRLYQDYPNLFANTNIEVIALHWQTRPTQDLASLIELIREHMFYSAGKYSERLNQLLYYPLYKMLDNVEVLNQYENLQTALKPNAAKLFNVLLPMWTKYHHSVDSIEDSIKTLTDLLANASDELIANIDHMVHTYLLKLPKGGLMNLGTIKELVLFLKNPADVIFNAKTAFSKREETAFSADTTALDRSAADLRQSYEWFSHLNIGRLDHYYPPLLKEVNAELENLSRILNGFFYHRVTMHRAFEDRLADVMELEQVDEYTWHPKVIKPGLDAAMLHYLTEEFRYKFSTEQIAILAAFMTKSAIELFDLNADFIRTAETHQERLKEININLYSLFWQFHGYQHAGDFYNAYTVDTHQHFLQNQATIFQNVLAVEELPEVAAFIARAEKQLMEFNDYSSHVQYELLDTAEYSLYPQYYGKDLSPAKLATISQTIQTKFLAKPHLTDSDITCGMIYLKRCLRLADLSDEEFARIQPVLLYRYYYNWDVMDHKPRFDHDMYDHSPIEMYTPEILATIAANPNINPERLHDLTAVWLTIMNEKGRFDFAYKLLVDGPFELLNKLLNLWEELSKLPTYKYQQILYQLRVLNNKGGFDRDKEFAVIWAKTIDIGALPEEVRPYVIYLREDIKVTSGLDTEYRIEQPAYDHKISITNLTVARRLYSRDFWHAIEQKDQFAQWINNTTTDKDVTAGQRTVLHAIYHQSLLDPYLFLRELLQNSKDAVTASNVENNTVSITELNDGNDYIVQIEDFVGMSFETVMGYLLAPEFSDKTDDQLGKFGIGFFTICRGSKKVVVKTGNGLQTVYFKLEPVFDSQGNIIDLELDYTITDEPGFTGTVIQKFSNQPHNDIESAQLKSAVFKYGQYIDTDDVEVILNEDLVNDGAEKLASITIGEHDFAAYHTSENIMIQGGIYVSQIPAELFSVLPPWLAEYCKSTGMAFEISKKLPLTRTRKQIAHKKYFMPLLEQAFVPLAFNAFIQHFVKGYSDFKELPYDYFWENQRYTTDAAVPAWIVADANDINNALLNGEELAQPISYQRYLTNYTWALALLARLKVIYYQKSKVSLQGLANMITRREYVDTKELPNYLANMISKATNVSEVNEKARTAFIEKKLQDWEYHGFTFNQNGLNALAVNADAYLAFIELLQFLTNNHIELENIGYYYSPAASEAHALKVDQKIHWNLYAGSETIYSFAEKVLNNSIDDRSRLIYAYDLITHIVETGTHEAAHLRENSNYSYTHNHEFYQHQARILTELIYNPQSLTEFIHQQIKKYTGKYIQPRELFRLFGLTPSADLNDEYSEDAEI